MLLARPAAVAAGSFLLAAALAGAGTVAPGRRTAGPATVPLADVVTIRPDAAHFLLDGVPTAPPTTAYCEEHYHIACYLPAQIRQAFNLPRLYRKGITGRGQTIIIVDSFGSPTVGRDLARFDKAAALPAPPSLKIIQPAGKVPPYKADSNREGWAGETDLDVEYAHAIAPGAKILLVETPTSENEGTTGFPQIVQAEEYVINHHLGGVISQSFSATEQTFPSRQSLLALRGAYIDAAHKGVTVLAASGDSGAADVKLNQVTYYLHRVTSWPDSDPLVTAVGGIALHLDTAGGNIEPPTVWNDTYNVAANEFVVGDAGPNPLAGGGGRSVVFTRPPFQDGVAGVVGDRRGVPDISMSAACNGAADMYQSFPGQSAGWYPTCGTSEATPEFAGIVALADQAAGHPLGVITPYLYRLAARHEPGIVDVASGNNTVSFRQRGALHTVRGFRASRGYTLAAGVGTVNAFYFVPELARAAAHAGGARAARDRSAGRLGAALAYFGGLHLSR
ncbi:MAG TPA: S53 family peptidase [Streptosporangiaceae bacterium]|nr:S53 family peptidase [Streptosporangiaceae bacterium]